MCRIPGAMDAGAKGSGPWSAPGLRQAVWLQIRPRPERRGDSRVEEPWTCIPCEAEPLWHRKARISDGMRGVEAGGKIYTNGMYDVWSVCLLPLKLPRPRVPRSPLCESSLLSTR